MEHGLEALAEIDGVGHPSRGCVRHAIDCHGQNFGDEIARPRWGGTASRRFGVFDLQPGVSHYPVRAGGQVFGDLRHKGVLVAVFKAGDNPLVVGQRKRAVHGEKRGRYPEGLGVFPVRRPYR